MLRLRFAGAVAALLFAGCGGGGGGAAPQSPGSGSPILLTPLSNTNAGSAAGPSTQSLQLSFTAAGALQYFLAAEPGYAGKLTESDTCSGIATFSPASGTGPSVVFTATATAAGTCTAKVQDATAHTAFVLVIVTTTGGNITSRYKRAAR